MGVAAYVYFLQNLFWFLVAVVYKVDHVTASSMNVACVTSRYEA
jgi:hypothetical protein